MRLSRNVFQVKTPNSLAQLVRDVRDPNGGTMTNLQVEVNGNGFRVVVSDTQLARLNAKAANGSLRRRYR